MSAVIAALPPLFTNSHFEDWLISLREHWSDARTFEYRFHSTTFVVVLQPLARKLLLQAVDQSLKSCAEPLDQKQIQQIVYEIQQVLFLERGSRLRDKEGLRMAKEFVVHFRLTLLRRAIDSGCALNGMGLTVLEELKSVRDFCARASASKKEFVDIDKILLDLNDFTRGEVMDFEDHRTLSWYSSLCCCVARQHTFNINVNVDVFLYPAQSNEERAEQSNKISGAEDTGISQVPSIHLERLMRLISESDVVKTPLGCEGVLRSKRRRHSKRRAMASSPLINEIYRFHSAGYVVEI